MPETWSSADMRHRKQPTAVRTPSATGSPRHGTKLQCMTQLARALLAAACFGLAKAAVAGSCGGAAAHQQFEESWSEATNVQGGRRLPDTRDPLLGYTDWPEDQQGLPREVVDKNLFLHHGCYPHLISRYKWYNGTLWTDQADQPLGFRQHMVEMLLISKWLYKDLPDMDIMFNVADQAVRCDADIPMLQHTALDPISTITQQAFDINLSHLVYPFSGQENETVNFTRGYTIPYKDVWRHWSLSPGQMRAYSTCVQAAHGNGVPTSKSPAAADEGSDKKLSDNKDPWAAARIPRLVWRGSTTGYFKGWPAHASTDPSKYSNPLEQAFWNKRLYMCAMARPYPWLDFGIAHVYEDWLMEGQVTSQIQEVMSHLQPMIMKPHVDGEAQSSYQLALSIDGNGAPWRLPKQMMGLTPIVKVDSPYKEFFARRIQPGVHFESASYDLTDLATTAKRLIDEAAVDSTRLQRMAVAAQEVVVQHLNALGQLDSFVWALLNLKAAYRWPLKAPEDEPDVPWQPVRLRPDEWSSHGLKHIRHRVERMFPNNFVATSKAASYPIPSHPPPTQSSPQPSLPPPTGMPPPSLSNLPVAAPSPSASPPLTPPSRPSTPPPSPRAPTPRKRIPSPSPPSRSSKIVSSLPPPPPSSPCKPPSPGNT